jgi:DNA-directed RNA polymerase subunit H (RpoH/RPB5)
VLSTSQYSVITKENQETVLRENGIDATKLCEAECEVDVARTIGAALLVTGSVSKIGAKMSLHMKLFHAERGQVLKIVRVSAADESELYELAYDEGAKLFREGLGISHSSAVIDEGSTAIAPVTGVASGVVVTFTVPRVEQPISVDDRLVQPGHPIALTPGSHRVTVSEGRCNLAHVEDIVVGAQREQQVAISVPTKTASVYVTATSGGGLVENAAVIVDGIQVGNTDAVIEVNACAREITVSSVAYGSQSARVSLEPGRVNAVRVEFANLNPSPGPEETVDASYADDGTQTASDDDGCNPSCLACGVPCLLVPAVGVAGSFCFPVVLYIALGIFSTLSR